MYCMYTVSHIYALNTLSSPISTPRMETPRCTALPRTGVPKWCGACWTTALIEALRTW